MNKKELKIIEETQTLIRQNIEEIVQRISEQQAILPEEITQENVVYTQKLIIMANYLSGINDALQQCKTKNTQVIKKDMEAMHTTFTEPKQPKSAPTYVN